MDTNIFASTNGWDDYTEDTTEGQAKKKTTKLNTRDDWRLQITMNNGDHQNDDFVAAYTSVLYMKHSLTPIPPPFPLQAFPQPDVSTTLYEDASKPGEWSAYLTKNADSIGHPEKGLIELKKE